MPTERVTVRGSERQMPLDSTVIGVADPNEEVNVTVVIRRRTAELPLPASPPIPRDQFAGLYGADPADAAQIERFAAEFDLTVGQVDLSRRSIAVSGTVAEMNEAFGTQLRIFQSPDGAYRGRTGELTIPSHLADIVVGVFGLDARPQAKVRFRRRVEGV